MKETDTQYIKSCCNGHPDDYRFLVQRYQGALLGHLLGRLSSRERAEEAAQESLVRAFFKIETLKKPERFFAWLLGIADRVVLEHQRQQQTQLRRQQILSSMQETSANDFSADDSLEKAIGQLPEAYRQMILLRYYSQLSCKEIAAQQNIPLGTVTKTLSRAYALLRQSMTQDNNRESEVTR